jgi:hypothetical protein
MTLSWRSDAPPNFVKLAVGRCLIATADYGTWNELALLTDTQQRIDNHPRLLRSMRFGDDDYEGHVLDVVPIVLHEKNDLRNDPWASGADRAAAARWTPLERFPLLDDVSEFLSLPAWLAQNEPKLFDRLFVATERDATLPDGTVLSAAETAAARLEVDEMRRQVERIRRDYSDDPEAAVGQAKELIETVCKTILGMTGGAEGMVRFPALVKQTYLHLGIDPSQVEGATVEAQAARELIGGVTKILNATDALRNARGTGHGRSGSPLIDDATARMTVGMVLAAVVYLAEVFEARTGQAVPLVGTPLVATTGGQRVTSVSVGDFVRHETFGEGQVTSAIGEDDQRIASVDFGGDVGVKRLLLRYAPLQLVR